jgi:tetratricopeptide (TPR) repeat protein
MNYMKKILILAVICLASCDEYLDLAPDNRAALDSKSNIASWLVSGYPQHLPALLLEMSSDNADKRVVPTGQTAYYPNHEEAFLWQDAVDTRGNDNHSDVWSASYEAIDVANRAIAAIEELGNGDDLQPYRGEALMIRAYNHFMMCNMFCHHYNEATSATDLGVPYVESPKTMFPSDENYDRGTVASVYEKLERDIEAGLPLIDDAAYSAPKYHFNKKAALALAARFYLFYGKPDKAIEYANQALGADLDKVLRDVKHLSELTNDRTILSREWINPNNACNFMLISQLSALGRVLCYNGSSGKLYNHSYLLGQTETLRSPGPWGATSNTNNFYMRSGAYPTLGCILSFRIPYEVEYVDQISGSTHSHSIMPAFTADETLLIRAEAYIIKGQFDLAAADLAKWMDTHTTTGVQLTRALINSYYGSLPYYTPTEPTVKKALHPLQFTIASEEQENFLHCLLHFRRYETMYYGLRWFDVKRYGIEIVRREVSLESSVDQCVGVFDELKLDDPRRAIQLPDVVIKAGMTPNPR